MTGGSSVGDGDHCRCSGSRSFNCISLLSVETLTIAQPGVLAEKTRWWSFFMPLKACRLKNGAKYSAQSYWGTITVPSSLPTSWAWFTTADELTTSTMSSRHPTLVLRKRCFSSPKHQSGANLVCPTSRKDISILSLSPARTRHAKYCITKRFLFWPEQLSACSWRFISAKLWCERKWWRRLIMQFAPFPMLTPSSIR